MTPALDVQYVQAETMIAASITGIGGDANIQKGTGETPEEADVKGSFYGETIFD